MQVTPVAPVTPAPGHVNTNGPSKWIVACAALSDPEVGVKVILQSSAVVSVTVRVLLVLALSAQFADDENL